MLYRHNWWQWIDFADAFIRAISRLTHLPKDRSYTVINTYTWESGVNESQIIEFDEPLESTTCYPLARISRSMAPFVFPYLVQPRWHHGYSIIIHKQLGLRRWTEDNLESPMTCIDGEKLVYITTDNVEDMALIKLKYREYQGEPSN